MLRLTLMLGTSEGIVLTSHLREKSYFESEGLSGLPSQLQLGLLTATALWVLTVC